MDQRKLMSYKRMFGEVLLEIAQTCSSMLVLERPDPGNMMTAILDCPEH